VTISTIVLSTILGITVIAAVVLFLLLRKVVFMISDYKLKLESCISTMDISLLEVHRVLQTPVNEDSAEIRLVVAALTRSRKSLLECIEILDPSVVIEPSKNLETKET